MCDQCERHWRDVTRMCHQLGRAQGHFDLIIEALQRKDYEKALSVAQKGLSLIPTPEVKDG